MLLNPYRFASGGGGGGQTVTFIAASGTTYDNASSQNQTIPALAASGDLLVTVAMHREAITPAAGWTLIDSINFVDNGVLQYLSAFQKVAGGSDAGAVTTWTQAAGARIAVHIHVYRGSSTTPTVLGTAKASDSSIFSPRPLSVVSATADGQIGIAAQTRVIGSSGAVISAGFTQTTPTFVSDTRLCVGYKDLANGQSTAGSVDWGTSDGSESLSLLLG